MRTNKEDRTTRTALTLLFGGVVFLILLAVALVIGALLFVLQKTGAIAELAENVFNNTTLLVLFLVGISLIIGAGLTLVLSRIMMRPMNRILAAMKRVSSGDYSTRLVLNQPLARHPAIREFTDSFNTMAEELGKTEILRSDFINDFSHEFKTPIVSIAGFAKLLKRDNLAPEKRQEYLDIIEEESARLSAMATNVLNLTKIENQVILTDVTTFNLSEQLRSCILLLEKMWSRKGIEWDLDFAEYEITANEELLKEVWINLLQNAIKFCNPGGTVSVHLHRVYNQLSVTVANTGSTILPEQRERIFQKFYQGDESHAGEGNGVGLAVVKAIVELHNGSVTAGGDENTAAFTVLLPEKN